MIDSLQQVIDTIGIIVDNAVRIINLARTKWLTDAISASILNSEIRLRRWLSIKAVVSIFSQISENDTSFSVLMI